MIIMMLLTMRMLLLFKEPAVVDNEGVVVVYSVNINIDITI